MSGFESRLESPVDRQIREAAERGSFDERQAVAAWQERTGR